MSNTPIHNKRAPIRPITSERSRGLGYWKELFKACS
jgi:hypothetical protein